MQMLSKAHRKTQLHPSRLSHNQKKDDNERRIINRGVWGGGGGGGYHPYVLNHRYTLNKDNDPLRVISQRICWPITNADADQNPNGQKEGRKEGASSCVRCEQCGKHCERRLGLPFVRSKQSWKRRKDGPNRKQK